MNLKFDEKAHRYTINGKPVPGVTTVLREAGLMDLRFADELAMGRGTAVHEEIEKDARAEIEGRIDVEVRVEHLLGSNPLTPYFRAWQEFKRQSKIEILETEERVGNEVYRYAGTVDLRVKLYKEESIIDIKTGGKSPWHPLQTAGYAECYDRPLRRFALYLRKDESYSFVEHTTREDRYVFLAALSIARWKQIHGVVTR